MYTQALFWPYTVYVLIMTVLVVLTILHHEGTNPHFPVSRPTSRVLIGMLMGWVALGIVVAARIAFAIYSPYHR